MVNIGATQSLHCQKQFHLLMVKQGASAISLFEADRRQQIAEM